jgi:hypothetical protein
MILSLAISFLLFGLPDSKVIFYSHYICNSESKTFCKKCGMENCNCSCEDNGNNPQSLDNCNCKTSKDLDDISLSIPEKLKLPDNCSVQIIESPIFNLLYTNSDLLNLKFLDESYPLINTISSTVMLI